MTNMKKIIMSIMMTAICTIASAAITQKIYLKNGSVLSGFIAHQEKDGYMEVSTDEAIICISASDITVKEVTRKESQLDKAWRKWAKDNDALMGYGNDKSFTLCNISAGVDANDSIASEPDELDFEERLAEDGKTFNNVRILERGMKVRFLQLAPDSYILRWDEIDRIEGVRSAKNALSGLKRTYMLKSGRTVEGEYAGESFETVSVFKSDGTVETMPFGDIKTLKISAVNPNQDISEQSPLRDVVTLTNNRTRRGIIVEQYNGGPASANYIKMRNSNGVEEKIMTSNIESIGKEKNTAYNPLFDILLKPGEVMVNREKAEFVKVTEKDDALVLDSIPGKVVRLKSKSGMATFDVEYNGDVKAEMFQVVTLTKKTVKKVDVYSFTYKDLARSTFQPKKEETSMNGTKKVTFSVPANAVFAIYYSASNRAIPIITE